MNTQQQNIKSEAASYHPMGLPYCHIESGRKVFISHRFQGGVYYVHPNHCGDRAFTCEHDELRLWSYADEKHAHQVRLFAEPDITFNGLIPAVMFAVRNNGELLTEFKCI